MIDQAKLYDLFAEPASQVGLPLMTTRDCLEARDSGYCIARRLSHKLPAAS